MISDLSEEASLSENQAVRYVVIMCGAILVEEPLFRLGSVPAFARFGNVPQELVFSFLVFDDETTVTLLDFRESTAHSFSLLSVIH